ncbi:MULTISPECIES: hypothetical protein [Bacillus amyloliquefaciens group]|uniref:hypothetical protein n=1 Tax=Bacillus amyloliquefaciens group TaxID=1938374 RepID=UPI0021503A6C|nr:MULTISPECIES: hypothetical protein [Bacillus amyloliquefaciens group]MCR4367976.1 hypothetical protein [Bacillus amyloliquefaciens]MCV3201475.1 hypothetical protein [Bacillus velezensis]
MPVIDNFFVIQFENDDYFKSFKLDGSGYKTSKGLHTKFKTTSAIRQIEVITR